MSLRLAKPEDRERIQEILSYSFPGMRPPTDKEAEAKKEPTEEERKKIEEELRWVLVKEEADGQLGQHVQIVPKTIHIDGNTYQMGGIGAVASLPEYRYGGGVMDLMKLSLSIMKERNMPFSELAPFSFAFYRKCGYEWGFRWQELKIPTKDLEGFKKDTGHFVKLTDVHIEEMVALYNGFTSRYNGGELTDAEAMKEALHSPWANLVYGVLDDAGKLAGYAQYSIKDNALRCRQFFYRDITAKRQLLHFFHRNNSQAEHVILTVPENDTTRHLLPNQYIPTNGEAGMMVRIVDMVPALGALRVCPSLSGSFTMRVEDVTAPWNHGVWSVTVANGRVAAEMINAETSDCDITINRLSQLTYGFMDAAQAAEGGMMSWRNEAARPLFEKVFSKRPTGMWTFF